MRSYVVLTVLVSATLVFGGADGRAALGFSIISDTYNEIEQVGGQQCPYTAIPMTNMTVLKVMLTKVLACHKSSDAFKQQLRYAANTDAYRRIFGRGCRQEPAARTCIAAVDADADTCLEATERKLWTTVIDFVRTGITATCGDGGEVVATIYGDELRAMTRRNQMRTMSCLFLVVSESAFEGDTDLAAYTLRKYNAMKTGRRCIVDTAENGRTSSNQFQHFMDQLLVNMKCLSPKTNDIVLCSTLEAADPIA